MNKKKVDSILKGVTAAGIAIGGVSTIQGADMVMAQEIENQVNFMVYVPKVDEHFVVVAWQ